MADKTTRWAFTAYQHQYHLFKKMHPMVRQWGWNTEICPDTQREHYQGYILTRQQHRFKGKLPADSLRKMFPGVHIEPAREWTALLNYCKKGETRAPGTEPHHEESTHLDVYSYSEDLLSRLPNWLSITELWHDDTCKKLREQRRLQPEYKSDSDILYIFYKTPDEYAYNVILKNLISQDVQSGMAVEFICQNPLFITMWKNKIRDLIFRRDGSLHPPPSMLDRQTDNVLITFD